MNRKAIEKPLKEYIEKIKQYNPEKIILWGSFARKEATSWSDIDIIILTSKKNKKMQKALSDTDIDHKVPHMLDVRILTTKEYGAASHLTIYHEAKREGIVLFRKPS